MPVIQLSRDTSREAVCLVFEKVNTGGKKLDAFKLLTAIYAGEKTGFRLREEWAAASARLAESLPLREHPLTRVQPTEFFQARALLHTLERRRADATPGSEPPPVSCSRETVLRVPLSAYERHAPRLEKGFERAGRFLFDQNIYWFKDLPYQSQIVPLAAVLAEIGERWEYESVRRKLARWYWCGVFGELYGGAIETRFAKDVPDLLDWISGGDEPTTVRDAAFRSERLDSLTSRLSAAYKGVHALLMRRGAQDFRSGQRFDQTSYFDEAVDIHHVFPRAWCVAARQKGVIDEAALRLSDTILNKTPLGARTNRSIGGNAPSHYLAALARQGGAVDAEIDQLVRSHLLDPALMRADQFDAFLAARREALLTLIEQAMGKSAYRGEASDEPIGEIVDDADVRDAS
jgi:hypothetical protein